MAELGKYAESFTHEGKKYEIKVFKDNDDSFTVKVFWGINSRMVIHTAFRLLRGWILAGNMAMR
ncbi:MAG: hypothetical protein WA162_08280 [Thermodesulfobacteriota bacterium]